MGAGSLQIAQKYSHGMQEHFPHQANPSPGVSQNPLVDIYFPKIVADPFSLYLDLAIQPSSGGLDPSRLLRDVQLCRTDCRTKHKYDSRKSSLSFRLLISRTEKVKKTTQYGHCQIWVFVVSVFYYILSFPQKNDFGDFYILNKYKNLTFENSVS